MTAVPHPELERWRNEFPILQTRTYLNSCSLGALSRRSMGYLEEYQALWNTMGASAWYELWIGRLAELRGRVGELWSAQAEEVALTPSVSAALSSIASAVDYGVRNRVVVAELDFPTLAYQWLAKPGVEVVQVPSDDGIGIPAERWAEYVDDRTAIVATSHVFYSSGYVQEISRIAEIARSAGALFLVDGYQAAGQLPVNPRELGADVYVGGPLKWLLGGPGMAFLWVREERIRTLEPTIASWFGARDQFDFRMDELVFREDASRFAMGTPAVPTAYTALGGLEIILEVGLPTIQARVAAMTEHLVSELRSADFSLRLSESRERRSGIIMARAANSAEAVDALAREGIVVDKRGEYVRISPHFYNTLEECQTVIQALDRVVPRKHR